MSHKHYPARDTYKCDICGRRISKPFDVPFDHKYSLTNTITGKNKPHVFDLNIFDMGRFSDENIKEYIEYKAIAHFRGHEICSCCVGKTIKESVEKNIQNRENYYNAFEWLKYFLSAMYIPDYEKHKENLPSDFTDIVEQYFEYKEEHPDE